MSDTTNTWLAIIAIATLVSALMHIGVLVVVALLARRVAQLTADLERQVKPIVGHLDAIGREATRAASLATQQVERADRLFGDVAGRVEHGLDSFQAILQIPAREGAALLSAFRAAFAAFRDAPPSRRSRSRADDEDALFI
ncbi:MAG: DUF948 domain-containing protein [Vicinamibacterales bacterium]